MEHYSGLIKWIESVHECDAVITDDIVLDMSAWLHFFVSISTGTRQWIKGHSYSKESNSNLISLSKTLTDPVYIRCCTCISKVSVPLKYGLQEPPKAALIVTITNIIVVQCESLYSDQNVEFLTTGSSQNQQLLRLLRDCSHGATNKNILLQYMYFHHAKLQSFFNSFLPFESFIFPYVFLFH